MALRYIGGDMFLAPKDTVLVNPVNTVGIMGAGLAKRFARLYPSMLKEYQNLCERGAFQIGSLFYWKAKSGAFRIEPPKTIDDFTPEQIEQMVKQTQNLKLHDVLNFPTKEHWKFPSRVFYIEAACIQFERIYREREIHKIVFPLLGCGLGGLDWRSDVKPIFKAYLEPLTTLDDYDIQIDVVSYKHGEPNRYHTVKEF